MSKRNKKFRSNRSAFKLEALEQRQLLATIVAGSGTEVGADIKDGRTGSVYDQILMGGSTVTVTADAGQTTRVDFLDMDGDIVRAEFTGAGQLNISLATPTGAAVTAVTADKYAITSPKYVQGVASFTITGSDATTSFTTTSLGQTTAFQGLLNPIFANGVKTGGNNTANVSRLIIVGDSTNLVNGSGTAFGTINAANAVFSDTSGVTGVYAPYTSFKTGSTITVGDVIAAGSATGVLQVGTFSDVKTITVAGGLLKAATGATNTKITDLNITKVISQTGTNTNAVSVPTQTIDTAANFSTTLANSNVTYTSGVGTTTIDGATVTQTELDTHKTKYLTDVVINNGLRAGLVFRALQFSNLTINGNLAGIITTDTDDANDSDTAEQGIGNVTVTGDILDGGYIESATSIGNVSVTGKVTHTTTAPTAVISGVPTANAPGVISTIGRSGFSGSIGTVTFGNDVSVTAAETLITANKSAGSTTGGIGNITGTNLTASTGASTLALIGSSGTTGSIGTLAFTGDVSITSTAGSAISSGRAIGAITAKSLTLNTATAGSITTTQTSGTIGNITTTGGNLTLTQGDIKSTASIGNIWVSTTGNLVVNDAISAATNIGNITVDSGSFTSGAAGDITTTSGNIGNITLKAAGDLTNAGDIIAAVGNIGDISIASSTASAINATIKATANAGVGGSIGNVLVTAGPLSLGAGGVVTAAVKIGNVTVTAGDLTIAAGGGYSAVNTGSFEGTSIGNVTVSAGKIVGATGNIEFQANKIGNVVVTGKVATVNLLSDAIFSAKGTTQATALTASIGNITLDNSLNVTNGVVSIGAAVAAAANNVGTGFSSTGNIGNVSITTATNGLVTATDATSSLVVRAGNSEMGLDANTLATGAAVKDGVAATTVNSVAIGNVTVSALLSGNGKISNANAAGTGLMILSGVDLIANGSALTAAQAGAAASGTALTSGSIGTVTLNDLGGAVARSAFNSATLTEVNTAASVGGSVIMADTMGQIKVNTGINILDITPTGLALKGAIGVTALDATIAKFTGNDTNKLIIVVL
jgi:hypothetical protein